VFNVDEQDPKNKYVFVVEGQFDAYAVGGVGLLTNEIAQQQAHIINQLGKEVIVIPDQDRAGLMLIKQAIDYGWSVAFPTWDDDVKDCADAVQRYGRLFVTVDAIKTAQQGEIKISVARNNLETRLALLEEK
jgi:DNA primase